MVTRKELYTSILRLMIPIAIQNIFSYGVQLLGGIMVAACGDVAVTAISLANQQYNAFSYITYGMSSGAVILVSRFFGAGEKDKARDVVSHVMRILISVSFIYSTLCFVFAKQIMGFYSEEYEIIEAGTVYLRIVAYSFFLNSLSQYYLYCLKSVENAVVSTVVFVGSFSVSLLTNYLLIEGRFGLPALGIIGAGIATLASRVFEVAACAFYNAKYEKKLCLKVQDMLRLKMDRATLVQYLKLAAPVIAQEASWGVVTILRASISGNVGSVFVTGISISDSLKQIAMIPCFAFTESATVLLSKAMGTDNKGYIKKLTSTFLGIGVLCGLFSMAFLSVFRNPIMKLYPNVSDDGKECAMLVIGVCIALSIPKTLEYLMYIGMFRALGDASFAFIFDIGYMIAFSIPLAWIAAFKLDFPLQWIYFVMWSDTILKTVTGLIRIMKGKKKATA